MFAWSAVDGMLLGALNAGPGHAVAPLAAMLLAQREDSSDTTAGSPPRARLPSIRAVSTSTSSTVASTHGAPLPHLLALPLAAITTSPSLHMVLNPGPRGDTQWGGGSNGAVAAAAGANEGECSRVRGCADLYALALLHSWGIDRGLDHACEQELHLSRPVGGIDVGVGGVGDLCFALPGAGGVAATLLLPMPAGGGAGAGSALSSSPRRNSIPGGPAALRQWCYSPRLTARLGHAVVLVCMRAMRNASEGLQVLLSQLISQVSVVLPEVLVGGAADGYVEPSLEVLASLGLQATAVATAAHGGEGGNDNDDDNEAAARVAAQDSWVAAHLLMQGSAARMGERARRDAGAHWGARLHRLLEDTGANDDPNFAPAGKAAAPSPAAAALTLEPQSPLPAAAGGGSRPQTPLSPHLLAGSDGSGGSGAAAAGGAAQESPPRVIQRRQRRRRRPSDAWPAAVVLAVLASLSPEYVAGAVAARALEVLLGMVGGGGAGARRRQQHAAVASDLLAKALPHWRAYLRPEHVVGLLRLAATGGQRLQEACAAPPLPPSLPNGPALHVLQEAGALEPRLFIRAVAQELRNPGGRGGSWLSDAPAAATRGNMAAEGRAEGNDDGGGATADTGGGSSDWGIEYRCLVLRALVLLLKKDPVAVLPYLPAVAEVRTRVLAAAPTAPLLTELAGMTD
jgi:hypothetical protein